MATRKTTTESRRCIGSGRFGIEPHDAPIADFPKQPSRKDGLGLMCAVHWKAYVKALAADRKARAASGEAGALTAAVDAAIASEAAKATTKRERRRTPMANKPEPARVRKARETLAATETLGGTAYTKAIGSDEVQDALETVNRERHERELVETPLGETLDGGTEETDATDADAAA